MSHFHNKNIPVQSPKNRTSKTFESSLLLGQLVNTQQTINTHERFESPIQIRLTPSNQSTLFTPQKQSQNDTRFGKKTFQVQQKIFQPQQPKQQHPMKLPDQPNSSFYPQDTNQTKYHQQNFISSPHTTRNHYADKDCESFVQLTSRQKKFSDISSNIFHRDDQQNTKMSETPTKNDLQSQLLSWKNPFVGKLLTQVNEHANFDKDYSHQLKIEEGKSSVLPISVNKSPIQINEKENNLEFKRKNQHFSDLFDQGVETTEKRIVRSISPSLQWTEFDSVRNRKDISNNKDLCNNASNWAQGQQSVLDTHQYNNKTNVLLRLSEDHIDCQKTYRALKGEGKHEYLVEKQEQKVIEKYQQYKKLNDKNTYRQPNSKQIYSGIYSWKNHYNKRK